MGDPSVAAEASALVDHARFRIDNFDLVSASGLVIPARGNVGYAKRVFSHAVDAAEGSLVKKRMKAALPKLTSGTAVNCCRIVCQGRAWDTSGGGLRAGAR